MGIRTVLYNPFTPFIVIFCQVIEAVDPNDLALFDSFVQSLETARHHSEATTKVHRQSKLLYEAAAQYTGMVAAKNTPVNQCGGFGELDACLQSLGMPPLGVLGNPGSESTFRGPEADQEGVGVMQGIPDPSLERMDLGFFDW